MGAWADQIAAIDLKIARQKRYVDFIEGTDRNLCGRRGTDADPDNPAHTDGCDPADSAAAAHRWTGTGGADAYFAWWRSQYPSVDENETDPLTLGVYEAWKDWSDKGSNYRAQTGMEAALTAHKQNITDLTAKKNLIQGKIDSGANGE